MALYLPAPKTIPTPQPCSSCTGGHGMMRHCMRQCMSGDDMMGQRAMQLQSDPFLGWTQMGARQFLVRQLNDHKGSIELTDLAGDGLVAFGEVCGELLARGHARSGDPLVIAGYLGSGDAFAEALAKFGSLYADQTEKDWQALRRSGKAAVKRT